MLYLEHKYLNLISNRLNRFRRKSSKLYNFRCPFCHDSQKNEKKARGYVFEKGNHLWFYCQNQCGGMKIETFIKKLDPRIWSELQVEKLKASGHDVSSVRPEESPRFDGEEAFQSFRRLKKISQLPLNHEAAKYVRGRQIPNPYHAILRWTSNFMEWTNSLVPGKFEEKALKYDCGRIIIPFVNRFNHFYGYQGRAVGDSEQRYISINLKPDEPMLFGMNMVDFNRFIYVFEGPIDSMFIKNAIAIAGVNFQVLTKALPCHNIVLCYDNEPHSRDTKKKITEAINAGLKVVIWPDNVVEKDVNAMVMARYSSDHIQYIIDNNIFEGMKAKIRLNAWSKC